MKGRKILASLTVCTLLLGGATLAAEDLDLADTAKAIRDGKIDVGKRYDMHKTKGRFHIIHSEIVGLECEGCHVAPKFAPDYLLVNKKNAELKATGKGKGQKADVVDRGVCQGCHKTHGVATQWYRTADK
jgi:hypothetical protein